MRTLLCTLLCALGRNHERTQACGCLPPASVRLSPPGTRTSTHIRAHAHAHTHTSAHTSTHMHTRNLPHAISHTQRYETDGFWSRFAGLKVFQPFGRKGMPKITILLVTLRQIAMTRAVRQSNGCCQKRHENSVCFRQPVPVALTVRENEGPQERDEMQMCGISCHSCVAASKRVHIRSLSHLLVVRRQGNRTTQPPDNGSCYLHRLPVGS